MLRLSYELIAVKAHHLYLKMVYSWDPYYHYQQYMLFITACGWTEFELDEMMLNNIDMSWELDNTIWN